MNISITTNSIRIEAIRIVSSCKSVRTFLGVEVKRFNYKCEKECNSIGGNCDCTRQRIGVDFAMEHCRHCDRVLMWRLDQFVTTNEMQVFAALMSTLSAILFLIFLLLPASFIFRTVEAFKSYRSTILTSHLLLCTSIRIVRQWSPRGPPTLLYEGKWDDASKIGWCLYNSVYIVYIYIYMQEDEK